MITTDEQLNQNIRPQPYDRLVKATLLWMFPSWVRPNQITAVRFIFSPLVFYLLVQGYYKIALPVFLLVALTDAIDGSMARTRRQITVWGTMYDSVADKFLIGGTAVILVIRHLGLGLAGTIIGLELIGLLGAWYLKIHTGTVREAISWGKIKMNLQVLAVALLIIDIIVGKPFFAQISKWVFIASCFFAVANMISHLCRGRGPSCEKNS